MRNATSGQWMHLRCSPGCCFSDRSCQPAPQQLGSLSTPGIRHNICFFAGNASTRAFSNSLTSGLHVPKPLARLGQTFLRTPIHHPSPAFIPGVGWGIEVYVVRPSVTVALIYLVSHPCTSPQPQGSSFSFRSEDPGTILHYPHTGFLYRSPFSVLRAPAARLRYRLKVLVRGSRSHVPIINTP